MTTTRKDPKQLVQDAYDYVHPDVESLARAAAAEHAIANMGQDPHQLSRGWGKCDPATTFQSLWSGFCQDACYDASDLDDERVWWLKRSQKDAKRVAKAGLLLTVVNCRDAFLDKGPFAKKGGAK